MKGVNLEILRKILPIGLFATHLIFHIVLGANKWILPFEMFNLLLLTANFIICITVVRGLVPFTFSTGVMFIIMSHSLIGQRIAPDALTSGSILMIDILIIYVGIKIFDHLPKRYFFVFTVSYAVLFFIFVVQMKNAEAIFLLALMGLAASARSFKLLAYFWALVLSFTLFQPYGWQIALLSFFFLKIVFSINGQMKSATTIIFLVCGLLLVFFVLFPVLVIVLQEDPRNIVNIMQEKEVQQAVGLTLLTATLSSIILAVFCIPLAYVVSRVKFYGKPFLLSVLDIPVIIPQSAAGIALLQVFGKNQFIGESVFKLTGLQFDGTILGIILAQVFVSLPFLFKSALAAFDAVPVSLEQQARILGASSFGAFARVALPLSMRGIFMGTVLAWARAAGEFGAVFFIAPDPLTAPIAVYTRFSSLGLEQSAPLVTAILMFSVVLFFSLQLVGRTIPGMYHKEGQI